MMSETKEIVLYNEDVFEDGYSEMYLNEFIEEMELLLFRVPIEYRNSAVIQIDVRSLNQEHVAGINISYERPYTDEEKLKIQAKEEARSMLTERNERYLLAALKKKYEGKDELL